MNKIKNIFLILQFLVLLICCTNLKISYANNKETDFYDNCNDIENIKLDKIVNYIHTSTMYVEKNLLNEDIKIKDEECSIHNIAEGTNLYIYLNKDLEKDYKIDINLENAEWFFRSLRNFSNNSSESSESIEGYDKEIEKYFITNYNLRNGIFIPSSKLSKTGIYYRKSTSDIEYKLDIKTPQQATLIFTNGAKKNDCIIVPLVTKIKGHSDASVTVKTKYFNSTLKFTDYNIDYKNKKTRTYVNKCNIGYDEFVLDNINITELYTGSIKECAFEIISQDGYALVPNIENINKNSYIDKNLLDIKDNGNYVVNVSLSGGIEWKNGKYKTGEGEREKDYTIDYSYFGPCVNKNKILIKIKDINTSKDIVGSITIKGLKLLKLSDYSDYYNEDIYLYIQNVNNRKIIDDEKFKVAVKSYNIDIENPNSLDNFEILQNNTKYNIDDKYSFFKDISNFANIDNYDIKSLIKMADFQKKAYIKSFNNNMIIPDKFVTRKEIADMLYNLLANTKVKYENKFLDCDNSIDSIGFCFKKGYIKGYEDNTFKPEKNITRAEFAKILNTVLDINSNYYTELLPKNHWAYKDVSNLIYKGIISGYPDGTFKENNNITMAEAIVMINKAFDRGNIYKDEEKEFINLKKDHWAYDYIMNAYLGY